MILNKTSVKQKMADMEQSYEETLLKLSTEIELRENLSPKQNKNRAFILYKHRWIILAIFSIVSMTNEVIWISLSSVESIVQDYYNVNYIAINWLSMLYSALYVFVVLSSYILDKYGLKMAIMIGAALNALGSCLRLIGVERNRFPFVFMGNASAAIANCFILFIPSQLAAVWFGEQERATASAIGMLMNMLGVAVGFLMGATMVPNSDDMNGAVHNGMLNLLISQAVFCSVLMLPLVIVIKDHPQSPPSMSQALLWDHHSKNSTASKTDILSIIENTKSNHHNEKTRLISKQSKGLTFFRSLVALLKNKSFHLIAQAYSLYFGTFVTYNTVLNEMMILKYPNKVREVGLMGCAAVIFGLVAIFLSGIWLDKTRRYRLHSIVTFAACAVSMLAFTVFLWYHDNFILIFVIYCVFGFFSYSYMSVGLEYAAEMTYPVPEGITSGILLLFGQIYGVILTYGIGYAIEKGREDLGGYIMAGTYLLGLFMFALMKAPLKRTQADHLRQSAE